MRTFESDNAAGVHPKVMEALAAANVGHASAYGADAITRRVEEKLRALFGPDAQPFLVLNGTGANVLGLQAMTSPHHAILTAGSAHIATDECGAPERFTGCKVITIATPDGKLTPALVAPHVRNVGVEHAAQPRVVSVTQSTEHGTVYAPAEMRALAAFCRERGLLLHVDGARLANAVASLGLDARSAVDGADAISLGGTKDGAMLAEAIVFLKPGLSRDFKFVRKQGMQLASKMRFVAAQMDALLTDGLWLDNARHANRMAKLLAEGAAKVRGVEIVHRVEANAVFARLPPEAIAPLRRERSFYVWDERAHVVRWVCSWDTTEDDVLSFVSAMRKVLG